MRVPALVGLMLVATVVASFSQTLSGLEGTWLTADGASKIRFELCPAALCGRLVWLREPNDPETGKPVLDKNNPNLALRNRALLGATIFTDVQALKPGEWRGKAYNAEDSKTYDVTLRLILPNRLELKGCGLAGLICQSETWTRDR